MINTAALKYEKYKSARLFTAAHKAYCLNSGMAVASRSDTECRKLNFSDEKRFYSDRPDGLQYYWHDLRKDKRVLSRSQSGGSSIMIWACFFNFWENNFVFLSGYESSVSYSSTLQSSLLEFSALSRGVDWQFQQSNVSIHVSLVTIR